VRRPILVNTLRVLLHAGFESAGRLLANGLVTLLAVDCGLARWHAVVDTERAVDELMRVAGPVQAVTRACVVPTELGGRTIQAGQAVTALLGAANRDRRRFAKPYELDFSRPAASHLAFGRGLHSCLGRFLAGLQARAVFGTLASEFPGLHASAAPTYRRNLTLRGPSRIPVRLQRAVRG